MPSRINIRKKQSMTKNIFHLKNILSWYEFLSTFRNKSKYICKLQSPLDDALRPTVVSVPTGWDYQREVTDKKKKKMVMKVCCLVTAEIFCVLNGMRDNSGTTLLSRLVAFVLFLLLCHKINFIAYWTFSDSSLWQLTASALIKDSVGSNLMFC